MGFGVAGVNETIQVALKIFTKNKKVDIYTSVKNDQVE